MVKRVLAQLRDGDGRMLRLLGTSKVGSFIASRAAIQKTKTMASGPIISWQIDGETVETVTLYFGTPKSLQMVTAAMNLKDAYSLEGKL